MEIQEIHNELFIGARAVNTGKVCVYAHICFEMRGDGYLIPSLCVLVCVYASGAKLIFLACEER